MTRARKCESCADELHNCRGFDDEGFDCTCLECEPRAVVIERPNSTLPDHDDRDTDDRAEP